jgi:hypothetical protein
VVTAAISAVMARMVIFINFVLLGEVWEQRPERGLKCSFLRAGHTLFGGEILRQGPFGTSMLPEVRISAQNGLATIVLIPA